jgi:hypothetical protein
LALITPVIRGTKRNSKEKKGRDIGLSLSNMGL